MWAALYDTAYFMALATTGIALMTWLLGLWIERVFYAEGSPLYEREMRD
jgi:hypothetical protein